MTSTLIERLLARRVAVAVAVGTSFVIGLFFIFVWAPHPWGWYGIDQYHQLATDLAAGRAFSTLDVPWAYAYFLAAFYRLFGPTPLPVLLVQNALNAAIPVLVYAFAARAFDRRVAGVAALLVGVASFNTIYVSTESTDSICTFLFMAMLLAFVRARDDGRYLLFTLAGALAGLAAQFRPNLILIPFVLLGLNWLLGPLSWRRLREGGLVVLVAAMLLAPWTIRNYRLTGQFMPTSTHGGIQLWYGTLQTGPYLESRAHNPRSVFATPPFDYTSLTNVPILIDARIGCGPGLPDEVRVVYRFGNEAPATLALTPIGDHHYAAAIPPPHRNAALYYYTEVVWPANLADPRVHVTPAGGAGDPFVYFVSANHLGDLDTDDRLLDLFDAVRLLRHLAWNEPVKAAARFDRDGDGAITEGDLREHLKIMLHELDRGEPPVDRLRDVTISDTEVRARFVDGTSLAVPRQWKGLATDLEIGEGIAAVLMSTRHRFSQPYPAPRIPLPIQCLGTGEVTLNAAYYRVLPHEMRRYMALSLDNISRVPLDYAWSVIYRAVRLFVIQGTDDRQTTQQFERSRLVYSAATLVTLVYFVTFLAGVWIAWRRGFQIWLPLALIAYVPVTIAFVLTNMRYTITVQPLLLTFAAVAVVEVIDRVHRPPSRIDRREAP